MRISSEGYFERPEFSNSNISAMKAYLENRSGVSGNSNNAFRFGKLVDAFITESEMPADVTDEELKTVIPVVGVFKNDPIASVIIDNWESQIAYINEIPIGNKFIIKGRCLCDAINEEEKRICDFKTTSAKKESGWEKSIDLFGYKRAAAWYLDITGFDTFILIAVGKEHPYPMFKTTIKRGSKAYKDGKAEYLNIFLKFFK